MRKVAIIGLLALTGCASNQSAQLFSAESVAYNGCMSKVFKMSEAEGTALHPYTKQSPYTEAMICYADALKRAAHEMQHPNTSAVFAYADNVVTIAKYRDAGKIDTPTAVSSIKSLAQQLTAFVNESAAAQQQQDAQNIAAIVGAMAGVYTATAIQQQNIRNNRPVICNQVGRTVVCQ